MPRNKNIDRNIPSTYRPSQRKIRQLEVAVNKYNIAVSAARKQAGFGTFDIDELATITTVPNILYKTRNLQELNRTINRLESFAKPGGTSLVYDIDPEFGTPTNIMFRAQREALESELRRENYQRAKMRKAAIAGQKYYDPRLLEELQPMQIADIIRTRGTNIADLSATDLTSVYRTELWRQNYLKKFTESSALLYAEPLTDVERQQIENIKAMINSATPEQISYLIYNEGTSGEIRSGPYAENLISRLSSLEAAWQRASQVGQKAG